MAGSTGGGGPPQGGPKKPRPDFSDVQSGHSTTAPAPPQKAAGERIHVVAKGENLSKIAQKYYGKANLWKKIFEANKDQIKNPDLIQPGWKLRIPE
jgi:nucleoid-associated protein YgaU